MHFQLKKWLLQFPTFICKIFIFEKFRKKYFSFILFYFLAENEFLNIFQFFIYIYIYIFKITTNYVRRRLKKMFIVLFEKDSLPSFEFHPARLVGEFLGCPGSLPAFSVGIAAAIWASYVSIILLKLSWFCTEEARFSIFVFMFSKPYHWITTYLGMKSVTDYSNHYLGWRLLVGGTRCWCR